MPLDMESIREFADLSDQKDDLEAKLDRVKARIEQLDPIIQEIFTTEGVDQLKANGRTIFVKTMTWAKVSDKKAANEALKKAGLSEFVNENYNHMALSAYVRERLSSGEGLPPEFEGIIGSIDVLKAIARKA